MQPTEVFKYWIAERWNILQKKERGEPKPWTKDIILQSFRFCNVRREDDAVTKWIRTNWNHPESKNLPLAMALARFLNVPDTLGYIGYPHDWLPNKVYKDICRLEDMGGKVWGSAYIVSTNGRSMRKAEYIVYHVLDSLHGRMMDGSQPTGKNLRAYSEWLQEVDGIGSFMAGQIIADLKNTGNTTWLAAQDWDTFCTPGPGSKRGLNRLMGRSAIAPMNDAKFQAEIGYARELADQVSQETALTQYVPHLSAQDVQNCLCEFDKYMRVKNGEGRPRQTYPGV